MAADPAPAYRHSSTARAVLRSLVPVICPPEAVPLDDAIVEHMALTLAAGPAALHRGFAVGLVAYDLGAIAERYYDSWLHGPTPLHRQLARGINQLMSLACYEQPEMMERVGYVPAPWIAEVTERRLTVFRDDVRRQDAQILAPDPLRPGVRIQRGRS